MIKRFKIILILKIFGAILLIFALIVAIFYLSYKPSKTVKWGLTFSQNRARDIGFDAAKMFDDIMTELKPGQVRLMAYWENIEATRGEYNFSEVDALVSRAHQGGAEVMLVVGHKQPRWPECHHPNWYPDLSEKEKQDALSDMLIATVGHFRNNPYVTRWQVENEALFTFGDNCKSASREQLRSEIDLVRSLDPTRPILVSDSGEFGRWLPTATTGSDLFGSTMYRVVHSPKFGYFKYPLPPSWFRAKGGMLQQLTKHQQIIGVELQAEPWFDTDIFRTSLERQYELMNVNIFRDNIEYAQASGFAEHYLWGVEWWYWMKEKHDDSSVWDAAKEIFD